MAVVKLAQWEAQDEERKENVGSVARKVNYEKNP